MSSINTECRGCGFAESGGDGAAPGCALGLVEKFARSGAAVAAEVDADGRAWAVVPGRLCAYRSPAPPDGHAARVRDLVRTKFLVVVWVPRGADAAGLALALRSVAAQPHKAVAVEVVTTAAAGVAYLDVIRACEAAFADELPWNVKLLPPESTRHQALDAAAAGHPPEDVAFYLAVDAGAAVPAGALGAVDARLNDEMARFLCARAEPDAADPRFLVGPLVHRLTHERVGGNARATHDLFDAGGTTHAMRCDAVEDKIAVAAAAEGADHLVVSLGDACRTPTC